MPLESVNVRMPADLRDAAKREARQQGINFSEYVRQALAVRLAWTAAVRAVEEGLPPEQAVDVAAVVRRLARVTEEEGA